MDATGTVGVVDNQNTRSVESVGVGDAIAGMPARAAEQSSIAIPLAPAQEPHFGYFATKRAVDIAVALLALIALSPLFLVVAVAIKLDSRGPVFYRHTRVGERGRWFQCYKFRSMEEGADARWRELRHLDITGGPTFKCERDPRVTRVGRFIRRTSIDELPQLFNVLRGDMSLVGPRPPLPAEVDAYTDYETARLSVAPGITCLWQVSGR
ncbi:MAG TPA: sugar transferase, partial [Dehalococcoidia bacterium]|nr:sugar transferase [Dehalococcoidia bacterium]